MLSNNQNTLSDALIDALIAYIFTAVGQSV